MKFLVVASAEFFSFVFYHFVFEYGSENLSINYRYICGNVKFLVVASAEFFSFVFYHFVFEYGSENLSINYRYICGNVKFLVVASAEFFLFIFCLSRQFLLWGKILFLSLTVRVKIFL
ncbi:MAG: hypothetical protein F6K22_39390 [Okeania sp. SIO2F4]|nr:hypothetical protein [Okeania sp. SIO2F4]